MASLNRWNKDSIRPGVVGSVGDCIGSVKLRKSSSYLPPRYDKMSLDVERLGSHIQDGYLGGENASVVEKQLDHVQGFKTAHGWIHDDLIPTDRARDSYMGEIHNYAFRSTVANINRAKLSGEGFLPLPGGYAKPQSAIPRGSQVPRVSYASLRDEMEEDERLKAIETPKCPMKPSGVQWTGIGEHIIPESWDEVYYTVIPRKGIVERVPANYPLQQYPPNNTGHQILEKGSKVGVFAFFSNCGQKMKPDVPPPQGDQPAPVPQPNLPDIPGTKQPNWPPGPPKEQPPETSPEHDQPQIRAPWRDVDWIYEDPLEIPPTLPSGWGDVYWTPELDDPRRKWWTGNSKWSGNGYPWHHERQFPVPLSTKIITFYGGGRYGSHKERFFAHPNGLLWRP